MLKEAPQFTPEEQGEIRQIALEAARKGETGYNSILLSRRILIKLGIGLLQEYPDLAREIRKTFKYEIAVVDEIVRRTRILMQFFGTDDLSILDKVCQEKGLGSLFDPESEASKRYGGLLYK